MAYDLETDFAMACLRIAEAEASTERQRLLALEQLYAGTETPRAEALADRALDESKHHLHDLLMKQRLAFERRFGSIGTALAGPWTGTPVR